MNAAPKSRRNPAYPDYERAVNEAFERSQAAMQKLETEFNQGWRSYQCKRPSGYGERALFCKQHARKYPATSESKP